MSDIEGFPTWLPDAGAILQAAIKSDLDQIGDLMSAALDEHGDVVPAGFAMAWIDTLRHHIGVPVGARVHVHHRHKDPGKECHTPPPGAVWASKLITARIGRDQQAFEAIFAEAITAGELGDRLICLLLVVAETINVSRTQTMAHRRATRTGGPLVAHTHGLGDIRPPV